jgi:hypothetical protein
MLKFCTGGEHLKACPSVTIQVRGGIGNQLFMYAMARRLSLVNQVPLYLETQAGFEGDFFKRSYGLNRFQIGGIEVMSTRPANLRRRATIAVNRILPFSSRWYCREAAGRFDARYLNLHVVRPTLLEGYWQDERYFSDIRSELKSELTFRHEHRTANAKLACEMRVGESVAVHVRQLHGVPAGSQQPAVGIEGLPGEYYRAAIQKIKERAPYARFYVFSDCRSPSALSIVGEEMVRVENEGDDAQYEDLWLMSQCRHFVLANSTFSWWGAWLGRSRESIVVSPVMHEWGQIARLPDEWNAIEWHRASQKDDSPCCERKTCRMDIGA